MSQKLSSFSALIRASRAVLGWSQSTLAEKADMATVSIARIEAGVISPRIDSARSIIRAFQDAGLVIHEDEPRDGFTLIVNPDVFDAAE
jgi:predicted transcriptional regulator